MTAEAYFMALGGLGVSLAGFAGLIAALGRRRQEALEPVQSWRIVNVVLGGAILTVAGLSVVAAGLIVEDQQTEIRIASAVFAFLLVYRSLVALHRGPAWDGYEKRWRGYLIGAILITAAAVANVFIGGVGFLAVLMLLYLIDVFGVFMNAASDFTRGAFVRDEPHEDPRTAGA